MSLKTSINWAVVIPLVSLLFAGFAAAGPEEYLTAWWKFDETSGTIANDSAGDADGTLKNGPTWTTGVVGGALYFDGTNDYVSIPALSGITNSITITCWIYPEVLSGFRAIYNHNGWSANRAHFQMWDPNVEIGVNEGTGTTYLCSKQQLSTGRWYHLAAIYSSSVDEGVIKIYINGVLDNSIRIMGTYINLAKAACIGAWDGSSRFFAGAIDDLRIYFIDLPEDSIKQLSGKATSPSPNDGAVPVVVSPQLSWQPGEGALSHDVYLGTDNPPTTLIADNITETSISPGPLKGGTTYYWRVDENTQALTITGDVWRFTTILEGSGTGQDPYQIATKTGLLLLNSYPEFYDKHFVLTADIDLSGEVLGSALIAPDGDCYNSGFDGDKFEGVFNGNGHVIHNLTINADCLAFVGLFGEIGSGIVENLGVENVAITANNRLYVAGGLVGLSYGTINRCYAMGRLGSRSDDRYIGGLVGINADPGSVSQCYATCAVIGEEDTIGGLVGGGYGSVNSSYWNTETSGLTVSAGGEGRTTIQMMQKATYLNWDFDNTWSIYENASFPMLKSYPPGDLNQDRHVDFYDLAILANHWLD